MALFFSDHTFHPDVASYNAVAQGEGRPATYVETGRLREDKANVDLIRRRDDLCV